MDSVLNFSSVPAHDFNVTVSKSDFEQNPNLFFYGADVSWMMTSSALVFLMIPGTALFNSGISGRSSAVSMMFLPLLTTGVLGLQWWLWGYTIAFTSADNPFWGSTDSFALENVLADPGRDGRNVPELVYAWYQCMFACFTGALVSGCVLGKGRFVPFLTFIIIWSTVIYDPIARWTWHPDGWSKNWGALDFAGGTAVHICAATTAAVYSVFFRLRRLVFEGFGSQNPPQGQQNVGTPDENGVQNMTRLVLGTVLLWVGWFGFNGGSALGANLRAVSACVSTFLAGCAGGITWSFFDYTLVSITRWFENRHQASNGAAQGNSPSLGKFSVQGFCNGVIAGLVTITPAAGYVSCRLAPLFGIVGAIFCSLCLLDNRISDMLGDTLNISVIHGIGGWIGMIMTGIFAQASVARLDGSTHITGGWLDENWKQIGFQFGDAAAGMAYAGVGTFIILLAMEALTYPFRHRSMEDGGEVVDKHDIIELEPV